MRLLPSIPPSAGIEADSGRLKDNSRDRFTQMTVRDDRDGVIARSIEGDEGDVAISPFEIASA
jgi:hypothetical protein